MLNKERINKKAEDYGAWEKSSGWEIGFANGATWASEQYTGVVSALETIILEYQRKNTPTIELSIAIDLAQSELNKLKKQ